MPPEGDGSGASNDDIRLSPAAGCLISVAVGLLGVFCVFLVITLVTRGELVLRTGELTSVRLWLVNEGGNQGVALSRGRQVGNSERADEACIQTHVSFLFWRESEEAGSPQYCDCYRKIQERWQYVGACTG